MPWPEWLHLAYCTVSVSPSYGREVGQGVCMTFNLVSMPVCLCVSPFIDFVTCGLQGPRRALSRELVALWSDDYEPAMLLLKRVFPAGLLRFLRERRPAPSALPPPTPAPAMLPQAREVHKQCFWKFSDMVPFRPHFCLLGKCTTGCCSSWQQSTTAFCSFVSTARSTNVGTVYPVGGITWQLAGMIYLHVFKSCVNAPASSMSTRNGPPYALSCMPPQWPGCHAMHTGLREPFCKQRQYAQDSIITIPTV